MATKTPTAPRCAAIRLPWHLAVGLFPALRELVQPTGRWRRVARRDCLDLADLLVVLGAGFAHSFRTGDGGGSSAHYLGHFLPGVGVARCVLFTAIFQHDVVDPDRNEGFLPWGRWRPRSAVRPLF